MKPKRLLLVTAVQILGVLTLYALLHGMVRDNDIVSRLLAAGPHLDPGDLILGVCYLLLRLTVWLLLPGLAIYRLTRVVWSITPRLRRGPLRR